MEIQFNTDHTIEGSEAMGEYVDGVVRAELELFSDQISRVEVHIRNEHIDKNGDNDDIHCSLEARLEGSKPTAATHHATTLEDALTGAVGKLHRLLEHTLGRRYDRNKHQTETAISELKDIEIL